MRLTCLHFAVQTRVTDEVTEHVGGVEALKHRTVTDTETPTPEMLAFGSTQNTVPTSAALQKGLYVGSQS